MRSRSFVKAAPSSNAEPSLATRRERLCRAGRGGGSAEVIKIDLDIGHMAYI